MVAIGPCCTRSVLLQRLANIPEYSPHAQLVRGYYWTNNELIYPWQTSTPHTQMVLTCCSIMSKKRKNNYRRAIPFAGLGLYLSTCISKCHRKLRICEESPKCIRFCSPKLEKYWKMIEKYTVNKQLKVELFLLQNKKYDMEFLFYSIWLNSLSN